VEAQGLLHQLTQEQTQAMVVNVAHPTALPDTTVVLVLLSSQFQHQPVLVSLVV
jgi:hypothetical protein